MDSPQEFTIEQAAEYVGVSERTLRNDIQAGRVAFVKRPVGTTRKSFFAIEELDRYRDERAKKLEGATVPRKSELVHQQEQPALPGFDKFIEALRVVADSRPALLSATDAPSDSIADLNVKKSLNIAEAARLSGLSEGAIRTAIKDGALNGKRIGKGYRVRPSDLDEYVNGLFAG